ncbi:MAG: ATP-binding protein [Polaromonas sp.]
MLKIRTHLVMIAAASLLPVVIFSAVALQLLRDGERDAALRGLHETARATALTVDRDLASTIAGLEQLARSPNLESGDLQRFYKEAGLLLKRDASWIVLLDANAQEVVNTLVRFGEPLPPASKPGRVREVIATQRPLVSNLILDQITKKLVTAVYVPVPAYGGERYVLAQIFSVEFFSKTVLHPATPPQWVVGIMDDDGRYIARSQGARQLVGQFASDDLMAAAGAHDAGLIRHRIQEGVDSYDAYTHSPISGWTIGVAAPAEDIEATAGRAVAIAGVGLLLAIAFATLAAAFLGRRLVLSIARVADAAVALGQGTIPALARSRVVEFDQLHTAMAKASAVLVRSQTLRTQAEGERESLLQDACKARLVAEEESRAKDQFLAMLGHELRNPLAAISGAIALSQRQGPQTAAGAEAHAVIQRQSRHLSHLVDDLLDASRITGGKIILQTRPVDLGKKVCSCLESLRVTGSTAGYDLKVTTEPVWVSGDLTRLEQVVNNLLVNAFKFSPPGSLVELTVGSAAGQAVLTVKDSGIGISRELMPHIFDLFVQGSSSPDRAQGGLGIGLALVHELVSLHGGTVSAESAGPGQGSSFVVRLPRIATPDARQAPMLPTSPSRWRILLIEDNDDARRMLSQLLRMEGHDVSEASTATAGLRLVALEKPDLAIVDIGLPDLTGYELAERLRGDAASQTMGLVALTGYGQKRDSEHAVAAGFDFHLVKSADLSRLLEVIDLCGQAALLRKIAAESADNPARVPRATRALRSPV